MINPENFKKGMSLLRSHFDKELQPPVLKIWEEYLSEELDDSEFKEAIKQAVLHSRFFPTAGELVSMVKGSKEAIAITQWQQILQSVRLNDGSWRDLPAKAQVALQAVGGTYAIANADSFQIERLKKEFCLVHQNAKVNTYSLPPQRGIQESHQPQPSDSPCPIHIKQEMEALKSKLTMDKFSCKNDA